MPLSVICWAVTVVPEVLPITATWSPTLTSVKDPLTASSTFVDPEVTTVVFLPFWEVIESEDPLMLEIEPAVP